MAGARRLPALSVVLAAWLAGCATPPAGPGGDGVLGVGDSWTLRITIVEDPDDGEYVVTVEETVTAIVAWRGVQAFEVDVRTSVPEDREGRVVEGKETVWLRTSDLAMMERIQYRNVTLADGSSPGVYRSVSTKVYDEPCPTANRGDLEAGQTWTSTCTLRSRSEEGRANGQDFDFAYNSTTVTSYQVLGEETVRVGAGSFPAYKVEFSQDGSTGTHWVAKSVCGPHPVRSASHYANDEHEGDTTMELVRLHC